MPPLQWLNPVLLYGLAGALVPLLIHLIHRKRAPEHEFPAVELLMSARRSVRSRLRLRHLLVMLLRMLLVLLVAAALARPYLRSRQALALGEEPTACVILLDDSLSMRYRTGEGGESLFGLARRRARRTLSRLRDFDRARVLTFSGRPVGPARFTEDHGRLSDTLREFDAGYGHHRAAPVLQGALRALDEAELPEQRLIVLSDLTRSSWEEEDFKLLARMPATVLVPDLWPPEHTPSNRHVAGASLDVADATVMVDLSVGLTGTALRGDFPVTLQLNRTARAERTLRVADREARTRLTARAEGRRFMGRVALPDDPLSADNFFYLTGPSSARPRVLLVDGDPRESIYQSESFYLDLALGGKGSALRARTITREMLREAPIEQYECLILANVPADSLPPVERIRRYLGDGGALWVILGDQIRARELRSAMGRLLPATPRSIHRVESGGDSAVHLFTEKLDHPIFSGLEPRWRARFGDAAIRRWWLLAPRPEARTVMHLENDMPLLVEGRVAGGRVLLAASPLDRDWNDLCIQPVFVPFVQQTVRYLAGGLAEPGAHLLGVGQTFRLQLPDAPGVLYLRRPESDRWEELPVAGTPESPQAVVRDTSRPGIYRIARQKTGEGIVTSFAVNPDPAASDLRRLSPNRLSRRLVERESRRPPGADRRGAGRPLWPVLLWIALAVLLVESLLARR